MTLYQLLFEKIQKTDIFKSAIHNQKKKTLKIGWGKTLTKFVGLVTVWLSWQPERYRVPTDGDMKMYSKIIDPSAIFEGTSATRLPFLRSYFQRFLFESGVEAIPNPFTSIGSWNISQVPEIIQSVNNQILQKRDSKF